MTRLVRRRNTDLDDCADDITRLRNALKTHGYEATDDDIAWAWAEFSETWFAATWYSIDDTPDVILVSRILKVLVPENSRDA